MRSRHPPNNTTNSLWSLTLSDLTEWEIQELLRTATPRQKQAIARLVAELRRVRDEQGAREYFEGQEQQW